MKCVFTWLPEKKLMAYFKQEIAKEIDVTFIDKSDKNAILKQAKDAEVLVGWKLDKDILSQANKLKYVLYPGAGIQHITKDLAQLLTTKGIVFCNSHGNAFATAEHAVALTLSLCNKVVQHHGFLKEGKWRTGDKEGKSISLRNKNIGLLGYGKIGQNIHKLLNGFLCNFYIFKRTKTKNSQSNKNVEYFSFEADNIDVFLSKVDIIICALPSTEKTKDLIDKKAFDKMKSDIKLVNVGRGDVINEKELYTFLQSNKDAGAAIDVWYNYRPEEKNGKKYPFNFPFHELSNCILSPHRAASPMDDPFRFEDVVFNINACVHTMNKHLNVINFDLGY